jgi:hypothetical protein
MWPNYWYLEARRLVAERAREADQAALARLAVCYRDAQRVVPDERSRGSSSLRRAGARLALTVGRTALRLARALDQRVAADGPGSTQAQLR